jgi:hypothetical protein
MFRSQSDMGDAVDLLLSLLTPSAIDTLMQMQEGQLAKHQIALAEMLCENWELDEEDLTELCLAEDVETAAANLIRATWSEARKRLLQ